LVTPFLDLSISFIKIPKTNLFNGKPVVDEKQEFPPVVPTHFLSTVAVLFPQGPRTDSAEESSVEQ
jgi:hypothetical protein